MWHSLQTDFAASLSNPDATVPKGFVGSEQRLNVYRNTVAVSLSDALGQTFPVVKQLVGAEFFAGMAQVYIRQSKPATPILFEYGETFAPFIKTFSPAEELPYLGDIAALEYAWLQAYHAADAEPVAIDVLVNVPEADLDMITFKMHPSMHLLTSPWPVASIWQAHQGALEPNLSTLQMAPEQILIIRPKLDVEVSVLSAPAYAFAAALASGSTLGAACANLEAMEDFEPAQHLGALFAAGAVTGIHKNNDI